MLGLNQFYTKVFACWEMWRFILSASECQAVWILIRTDSPNLSDRVQTVRKGYQQTTKVATGMQRVNRRTI